MAMEKLLFSAPCLFGIEGVLADELRRMGAADVTPQNGRVLFAGDLSMLARANICSRYAERILLVLGRFTARSFDELFERTKALPWERFIGKADRFPVKGHALSSALHSIPDCQAIVKKAIVSRLQTVYHTDWFDETGALCRVQFAILKDEATLMIDTSGEGLHKRGWREYAGGAPIRETLAAAMVDVTKTRFSPLVCDPCCGSGTLLIEAILAAKRMAPGMQRHFAAMDWDSVPAHIWREERERAKGLERPEQVIRAVGGDVDEAAVRLTLDNAAKAGVADALSARTADLARFEPDGAEGVVLCNPPYGERMLDIREAENIIRTMGRVFVPKTGWTYAVISPHEDFENLFGRPASRRRKLYNGMLKCQLYIYKS